MISSTALLATRETLQGEPSVKKCSALRNCLSNVEVPCRACRQTHRAVGEVSGPYEYAPIPLYHRRKSPLDIHWLVLAPLPQRPGLYTRHSGPGRNPGDPLSTGALSNTTLPHILRSQVRRLPPCHSHLDVHVHPFYSILIHWLLSSLILPTVDLTRPCSVENKRGNRQCPKQPELS